MISDYKHGLMCCRLQPLHKGHVRLIKDALDRCSVLSLVVGSAQEQRTLKNPFSAEERQQMLYNCFEKEIRESRLHYHAMDDIHNPPKWAEHVLSRLGLFSYTNVPVSIYFAGSQEDGHLFKEKGLEIYIRDREKDLISGTEVRELLLHNDLHWKDLVPEVNQSIIEEVFKNSKTFSKS